jgi:hypothetical protein
MDAASPSTALLEANRQLATLRAKPKVERPPANGESTSPLAGITGGSLPPHLGWGSQALSAVLHRGWRHKQPAQGKTEALAQSPVGSGHVSLEQPTDDRPADGPLGLDEGSFVKLYPTIGLAMLRQEQAAAGRVWMLARYLDRQGAGCLRIDILTASLTGPNSPLRLCSPRQLRNLLQQGDGIFWTRAPGPGATGRRLWLRSTAKVAHALGVERLAGRPVDLPLSALLNGIGDFRAHLYASFHSGRAKETPNGRTTMPIARQTLTAVSGVGRRSQRAYEKRLRLPAQPNFAVGEAADSHQRQERAWRQGRALFELKDYRGRQGKKGKRYLAWQLPNRYSACHAHRPKGRQRRINRELKALVLKGTPGNVEGTAEVPKRDLVRRYYATGPGTAGVAAQASGRWAEPERYWRRHQTQNQRFDIWQVLRSG